MIDRAIMQNEMACENKHAGSFYMLCLSMEAISFIMDIMIWLKHVLYGGEKIASDALPRNVDGRK